MIEYETFRTNVIRHSIDYINSLTLSYENRNDSWLTSLRLYISSLLFLWHGFLHHLFEFVNFLRLCSILIICDKIGLLWQLLQLFHRLTWEEFHLLWKDFIWLVQKIWTGIFLEKKYDQVYNILNEKWLFLCVLWNKFYFLFCQHWQSQCNFKILKRSCIDVNLLGTHFF